jgi:hypothetical protein
MKMKVNCRRGGRVRNGPMIFAIGDANPRAPPSAPPFTAGPRVRIRLPPALSQVRTCAGALRLARRAQIGRSASASQPWPPGWHKPCPSLPDTRYSLIALWLAGTGVIRSNIVGLFFFGLPFLATRASAGFGWRTDGFDTAQPVLRASRSAGSEAESGGGLKPYSPGAC